MATTKSTTAKQAAPRKTAAKKAAPRKTAAKKATTAKTTVKRAAKQTTATTQVVRESIASAAQDADDTLKQYAAVTSDQLSETREFVRGLVDIYVGIPFVLQSRLADGVTVPKFDVEALKALFDEMKDRLSDAPSVDLDAVRAFLGEAKREGHVRVASVQSRFEPAAQDVTKRFDAAAERIEDRLPSQLGELLESGRARLRNLYAA